MKKESDKPKQYRTPDTHPSVAFIPQKNSKLKVLYISEDAWCASIFFIFGATDALYEEWMKGMWGRDDKKMTHSYLTTEVKTESGATADVIAFRDDVWTWGMQQMATLVHECHHVTTNILLRKGLVHSRETEEAWAYLQDSLYLRITWALKNPDKVQRVSRFVERMWQKPKKKRRLAKKPHSK